MKLFVATLLPAFLKTLGFDVDGTVNAIVTTQAFIHGKDLLEYGVDARRFELILETFPHGYTHTVGRHASENLKLPVLICAFKVLRLVLRLVLDEGVFRGGTAWSTLQHHC